MFFSFSRLTLTSLLLCSTVAHAVLDDEQSENSHNSRHANDLIDACTQESNSAASTSPSSAAAAAENSHASSARRQSGQKRRDRDDSNPAKEKRARSEDKVTPSLPYMRQCLLRFIGDPDNDAQNKLASERLLLDVERLLESASESSTAADSTMSTPTSSATNLAEAETLSLLQQAAWAELSVKVKLAIDGDRYRPRDAIEDFRRVFLDDHRSDRELLAELRKARRGM